jgi:hypothetical protein
MLRQDRHQPDHQHELPIGLAKEERDRSGVGRVDPLDLFVVGAVVRPAMVPQRLEREADVRRGDGRAVGKARPGAQLEGHLPAVGRDVDRVRKQPVERERFRAVARHQALEHIRPDSGNALAPHDEGIGAVERAGERLAIDAPLRRLRIDPREGSEFRRQLGFAMHGNAMPRLGDGSRNGESNDGQKSENEAADAVNVRRDGAAHKRRATGRSG